MSRLNHIEIDVIPYSAMRYRTVGDYYEAGCNTFFRIASLGDSDMEFLVALHEFIEQYLCMKRGISEPLVIKPFDEAYENQRKPGDFSEPGDAENCPYGREHKFATKIEMQVAEELGVNWDEYTERVNAL